MSYSVYLVIRQVLMGVLFFLGLHMLIVSMPQRVRHTSYRRSLRIMGLSYLLIPVSCYIYTLTNRFDLVPRVAMCINLTAYYTTYIIMAVAFLVLLGKRFSRWSICALIAVIVIFPIPLWTSYISGNDDLISTVITASYSYFVIMVILLIIAILHNYRKVKANVDNRYTEDVVICSRWFAKSIPLLLGMSITSVLSPLFFAVPRYFRFALMIYGVLCYLHIHYGYRKMLINLSEYFIFNRSDVTPKPNIEIVEQPADNDITLSRDVVRHIEVELEKWLVSKVYLRNNVNINDVAKSIGSNRTYLSKYINKVYGSSFKSWVTRMRVEDAKILMRNDHDIRVVNVAEMVGFASMESFIHIFTRIEGMSPNKWREANGRN